MWNKIKDVRELSGIGDGFVNLIYSLAVSNVLRKPVGKKASNLVLSEAINKAGIRSLIGKRVDKHDLADYAEGLIFQAWIQGKVSIEECVDILVKALEKDPKSKKASIDAFSQLLERIM
jgi:hypothetical protein